MPNTVFEQPEHQIGYLAVRVNQYINNTLNSELDADEFSIEDFAEGLKTEIVEAENVITTYIEENED